MKLGVFTTLLSNLSLEEALKYFKSLGIEMVEIGCGGYPGNAHADPEILLNDDAKRAKMEENVKQFALTDANRSIYFDLLRLVKEKTAKS